MSERDMRNIYPLPSGNLRVRIEYRGEVADGVVSTHDEAITLRDELRRQIVDGELLPAKGKSAKDLGPHFLGSRNGNRSAEDDSSRWNRHIAMAPWARRALSTVTRADGKAWLKALKRKRTEPPPNSDPKKRGGRRAERLGWQTRKHCLNLARAFFEWAVGEELIAANPFAGLKVEREDGDEDAGYQDTWYLDADEQVRFLATWDSFMDTRRREKAIVAFALGTGLRLGELCCLHVADVHLDGSDPHIVVRYGSWDPVKHRYRSPKGRKGEKRARTVPLFGIGLAAAREWMLQLRTYAPKNPLGLMFPTERGCRRDRPPRSWDDAREAFGVVPRIGQQVWFHLLRHSFASSLISGWWGMSWRLEPIAKIMGHVTTAITEQYAHLAPKAVHDDAARAHAAYTARRHAASTASGGTVIRLGKTGHARPDSNRRHSASKAVSNATQNQGCDPRAGTVEAILHILRAIASGTLPASATVVAWLEVALDSALAAYGDDAQEAR